MTDKAKCGYCPSSGTGSFSTDNQDALVDHLTKIHWTENWRPSPLRCHMPSCAYATLNPTSMGMHRSYKHNPTMNAKIRRRFSQ